MVGAFDATGRRRNNAASKKTRIQGRNDLRGWNLVFGAVGPCEDIVDYFELGGVRLRHPKWISIVLTTQGRLHCAKRQKVLVRLGFKHVAESRPNSNTP
jgi:hypothetical protein